MDAPVVDLIVLTEGQAVDLLNYTRLHGAAISNCSPDCGVRTLIAGLRDLGYTVTHDRAHVPDSDALRARKAQ